MEEEVQFLTESTTEKMNLSIHYLNEILTHIRAGKASPVMLSAVLVNYYGAKTPLSQVANITVADAMTLTIQPWERSIISDIEKGIHEANIGFNPSNNGDTIIISIPPLTEERRRDLVKQTKVEGENSKIAIRNIRKEANALTKKIENISEDLIKNTEEKIQVLTSRFIKTIDEVVSSKEKEIMTV
ncbi:MAG: ribosome recycling factor [Solirubrobacteraceae bacterium]